MRRSLFAASAITYWVFSPWSHAVSGWIEPNLGQADASFGYVVRAQDLTALIASDHVALHLPGRSAQLALPAQARTDDVLHEQTAAARVVAVRLELLGARGGLEADSGPPVHGVSRYFHGSDARRWLPAVPHIGRVRYRDVYAGVDVVYRVRDGQLEYDFELAPGADPHQIKLRVAGAHSIDLAPDGQWIARTSIGEIRQRVPAIFRLANGQRVPVDGGFVRRPDNTIGFALADPTFNDAVVIDPIVEFSGYVGGGGADFGSMMRETAQGDFILVGTTRSLDLPTAATGVFSGAQDVFVSQIDRDTGAVDWVAYVGGTADDYGDNMQLDSAGNIIVVGYTASSDYPTVNAFQSAFAGSADLLNGLFPWDATIFKLTPDGSGLVFSTYLGGVDIDQSDAEWRLGFEWARGIAVGAQDEIYVAGQTAAADFPATQDFLGRSCMETDVNAQVGFVSDIFVAKFTADGTRLAAVCIGGTERDGGRDLHIGADGGVYVGGFGRSGDLPGTAGSYQPTPLQPLTYAPFVMKLTPDLSGVTFATYVGEGIMQRFAVDDAGSVYGSGFSYDGLFPVTAGAFQTTFMTGDPQHETPQDGFVFKLRPDATGLVYATYLGGSRSEELDTIEIDSAGRAYLAGTTDSDDFPLRQPVASTLGPMFGDAETINGMSESQGMLKQLVFINNIGKYLYIVARNGVNRWFMDTPIFDAPPQDLGAESADSRAVVAFDGNGDGTFSHIMFANVDAPQHTYAWDEGAGNFVRGPDYGAVNGDSRDAAVLLGSSSQYTDVVVANYGQPNEITSGANPTPLAAGRPDGNTTSVVIGTFGVAGSGQSIVFGNDGQDVRLLPYLGGGSVGPAVIVSSAGTAVSALAAGDLDGDGIDELIIGNRDGVNQIVSFAGGVPGVASDIGTDNDETLSLLLIDGDFDGDLDLLVGNAGADRVYRNDGNGALTRDEDFAGGSGPTLDVAGTADCLSCSTPYLVTTSGVSRASAGRRSIFAAVLNPQGSALEFSTLLDGGGDEYLFRGLSLAGSGRMLIAGATDGARWPQVGRGATYSGQRDAIFMVLNVDQDGDSVFDGVDNCLIVANSDQRDTNADGFGNLCDADLNNDGVVNVADLGLLRSVFFTADADADLNGDGVVNVPDLGLMKVGFFAAPGPSGLAP